MHMCEMSILGRKAMLVMLHMRFNLETEKSSSGRSQLRHNTDCTPENLLQKMYQLKKRKVR